MIITIFFKKVNTFFSNSSYSLIIGMSHSKNRMIDMVVIASGVEGAPLACNPINIKGLLRHFVPRNDWKKGLVFNLTSFLERAHEL